MDETYLNPVYTGSCPDPFVLKFCGEYWAYCTGLWHDGRYFGILRSPDLVDWQPLAGALAPLPEGHLFYWAPEVVYHNGSFFLYYSVGSETLMHLRVAVAEHPAGPFVDSGRQLTHESFAIDAHVFVDDDGSRHMFYASDFVDHSHIGTGTVRDRMPDSLTLAGEPHPVTLPRYDWQVYDPQRLEKGGVRWHTVEGSFVLKRKGRYYQMFSGGNWQNISYGVSYAIAENLDAPGEWSQVADGEAVLPVLQTLPGLVIGPGHNSVVRGPDNQQLFCVYHRWSPDASARMMAIDPLDWAGERLLVLGPSTEPQPAPLRPSFADLFEQERDAGLGPGWQVEGGRWTVRSGAALQSAADGEALARCNTAASSFVAELSLRALEDAGSKGAYGVSIGDQLRFLLEPTERQVLAGYRDLHHEWREERLPLPPGFNPYVYHLLRLELNEGRVAVTIDDHAVRWHTLLPAGPQRLALHTTDMAATFAGFGLTVGWQELFTQTGVGLAELGWQGDQGGWRIEDQQLWSSPNLADSLITKGPQLEAYELVVNVLLESVAEAGGCYGICPATTANERGPLLTVERDGTGWALRCRDQAADRRWGLPADFDPFSYQQFRLRNQGGQLTIAWEDHAIGEIAAPSGPTAAGLYSHLASAAFDMVRVTAIV